MFLNKRASIELSMNFIVVMIICLVIMGVGIMLMAKGAKANDDWLKKIDEQHKQQLQMALDDGALVSVYPSAANLARGESKIFTLGIRNELDSAAGKTDFCFLVTEDSANGLIGNSDLAPKIAYLKPSLITINTKSKTMTPISIKIPKTFMKGSYLFNVDVNLCDSPPSSYGNRQKLQINVR